MGLDPERVSGGQGRHATLSIELFLLGIFTYLTDIGAKKNIFVVDVARFVFLYGRPHEMCD